MKYVKRSLQVLAALVALAVVAVGVRFYAFLPRRRAPADVHAPATKEAIARGDYLANHVLVCTGCHSPVFEDQPGEPIDPARVGAGRDFGDHPELLPGHLRAPNLTADRETGLGAWSDGEILRAMREGIGRDGRPLFPIMPYATYGHALGDDDALAVIAYLRTLPPVRNAVGKSAIDFPISMFARAL